MSMLITPYQLRDKLAADTTEAAIREVAGDMRSMANRLNGYTGCKLDTDQDLVVRKTGEAVTLYEAAEAYPPGSEDGIQGDYNRIEALRLLAEAIGDYEVLCKRAIFLSPGVLSDFGQLLYLRG